MEPTSPQILSYLIINRFKGLHVISVTSQSCGVFRGI